MMGQNSKKIQDAMAQMQSVKADDPDLIDKLNEIALLVAKAQGRVMNSAKSSLNNIEADPMDELGCEGCQ
jgi:hypothetical protein